MAWITTENQQLNYQELNQKALRADTYRNVREVIKARLLAVDAREMPSTMMTIRLGLEL